MRSFGTALALAACAFLVPFPLSSTPPRGKLKPSQQKYFKARKAAIKTQERAAIRQVKAWAPAVKRTQRRVNETTAARNRSRDALKQKYDALQYARNTGRILGLVSPRQLQKMEAAYTKAVEAHVNGPKRENLAAQTQHSESVAALARATGARDAARADLVARKNRKDSARAQSLREAQAAKQAKLGGAPRPRSVQVALEVPYVAPRIPVPPPRIESANRQAPPIPAARPGPPAPPPPRIIYSKLPGGKELAGFQRAPARAQIVYERLPPTN